MEPHPCATLQCLMGRKEYCNITFRCDQPSIKSLKAYLIIQHHNNYMINNILIKKKTFKLSCTTIMCTLEYNNTFNYISKQIWPLLQ